MERDLTLARRALDAGASGYLFKDSAHMELIEAVRAAAAGERHLSPAVAAGLKNDGGEDETRPLPARDRGPEADGPRPHQPRDRRAARLSVRTVETHRAHIQQKLGLSSRPELTRYALERLIDT